jgi:hypothetical protein
MAELGFEDSAPRTTLVTEAASAVPVRVFRAERRVMEDMGM